MRLLSFSLCRRPRQEGSQAGEIIVVSSSSSSDETMPPRRRQTQPRPQQRPPARVTSIDALPRDLLVSIFSLVGDVRFVRENIPLVRREWRDIYRSTQASPLHRTLKVDVSVDSGQRALAWASRRSGVVRRLVVEGGGNSATRRDFTTGDLVALVANLGRTLEDFEVRAGAGALLNSHFFPSLWAFAGSGSLQSLDLDGIETPISARDAEPLGRIEDLQDLRLDCNEQAAAMRGAPLRRAYAASPSRSSRSRGCKSCN